MFSHKEGMYKLKIEKLSNPMITKPTRMSIPMEYVLSAMVNSNMTRIINPTGRLVPSEIEVVNGSTRVMATVDLSTCGMHNDENVSIVLLFNHPDQQIIEREMRDDGLGNFVNTIPIPICYN